MIKSQTCQSHTPLPVDRGSSLRSAKIQKMDSTPNPALSRKVILYLAIATVIIGFIPILSFVSCRLGFTTFIKALHARDRISQVLSIIGFTVGVLMSCYSYTVLCIFLFHAIHEMPWH